MEMKRLVCTRNECPDTCFLCEQEGKDYCMICADACTETEYQETYKEHTIVKKGDKELYKGTNSNRATTLYQSLVDRY